MEILEEYCTERVITKVFKIKVDDKTEVEITKWVKMYEDPFSGSDYEGDWEFSTKDDKAKYDALPDDVQDELHDFIVDLDM